MNETKITTVIDNLSSLIYSTVKELTNEQRYPDMNADTMEDNLKTLEVRYKELKKIRSDFERICTDII